MRQSPRTTTFLLAAGCLAAGSALAASLPKGGGEPGKGYLDCIAKLAGTEKPPMIAACLTKSDPWLQKANVDYFTPPNFALELKQNNSCLRLVGVQIDGGTLDGKSATLKVRGIDVIQRLEPTDEITEVDRSAWRGTLVLTQTSEGWRCTERKGD